MARYRKKPVVIEAFQLGLGPIPDWFMDKVSTNDIILRAERLAHSSPLVGADIKTLEGVMRADAGDFYIKGVAGEIYPCKKEIFAATYEVVAEAVKK